MKEEIVSLLKDLKGDIEVNKEIFSYHEASTKQAVVLPMLQKLGWNTLNVNEVHPEYSVGGRKVDYSLRYNGRNKVFIEVKKIGEDLKKHEDQLLDYAFREGVNLAVLTNGIVWWFYLPLKEGSWQQRRFLSLDVLDQNEDEVAQVFIDILSKEKVISGEALKNAEKIHVANVIKETLPKAWERLINEPDDHLVELLSETTREMCGYRPDDEAVKRFIRSIFGGHDVKRDLPVKTLSNRSEGFYTGKIAKAFIFKGRRYDVKSWKEVLVKVCGIMADTHRKDFDRVLEIHGRKKPYFSRSPQKLRAPELIEGTDIYVETNLSAEGIVKLSRKVISLFGYDEGELSIEAF